MLRLIAPALSLLLALPLAAQAASKQDYDLNTTPEPRSAHAGQP